MQQGFARLRSESPRNGGRGPRGGGTLCVHVPLCSEAAENRLQGPAEPCSPRGVPPAVRVLTCRVSCFSYLYKNEIQSIDRQAFQGLASLEQL